VLENAGLRLRLETYGRWS